jgi:methyl acetate hydrolase
MSVFESAIEHALGVGELVGGVAVATDRKCEIADHVFGWRDLATRAPTKPDTVFMLASMTKTVTSVAAMQLVEQRKIALDQPVAEFVPELVDLQVLDGFDVNGAPRLRPAKRPVTLRHLLTHTSGFGHEVWSADIARYQAATGTPTHGTQTNASLRLPLLFDPGEKWEYGIGLEWVGKVVEAISGVTLGVYFRDNVTGPLGMRDTTFGIAPIHQGRVASVYQRDQNGRLTPIEMSSESGEYEAGGGGLYGTAGDYLAFLRMLLNDGEHEGRRILKPETVALMGRNHSGSIVVTTMKSRQPDISNNFELFPDMSKRWGLGAMITPVAVPDGRSAGSQTWGGIANCYYWLDPVRRIAGVFLTQIMPFGDKRILDLSAAFERDIYGAAG